MEEKNSFSIDKFEDMHFNFDLGLVPEFELNGLTKGSKFKKYIPIVPTKWIDEAIEKDRDRKGEPSSIEGGDFQDKDILKLNVKEVGGELEKSFSVLFEDLSDDMKAAIAGKKKGDSLTFDIMTMEKASDESRVRKYILGVEDGVTFNNEFEGTIEDITRVTPAELNEAFFTAAYGEGVTNEEEARTFITGEFSKYFDGDSWGLLVRELQDHIIAANDIALPDEFLKRWLIYSDERNSKELVERDYSRFANNLRWTIMRDRIIAENEIHLHKADVLEVYKERARASYGSQLGEEFLDYFAERMLEDASKKPSKEHSEVEDTAMFNKVFKHIATLVDVTEVYADWDEFNEKREAAVASANVARQGEELNSPFEDAEIVEESENAAN
jgi:trigger factor